MLIVLGLFGVLATTGIIVGINSYHRQLVLSDVDTSIVLLQQARTEALNSIGGKSIGVYFGDTKKFVVFRGNSYATRDPAHDSPVTKNSTGTPTGAQEIVFAPVSASSAGGSMTLKENNISYTVTINNEGGITW